MLSKDRQQGAAAFLENGPELHRLFTPHRSGQVDPEHILGGFPTFT
jgi:hypothetical protein